MLLVGLMSEKEKGKQTTQQPAQAASWVPDIPQIKRLKESTTISNKKEDNTQKGS